MLPAFMCARKPAMTISFDKEQAIKLAKQNNNNVVAIEGVAIIAYDLSETNSYTSRLVGDVSSIAVKRTCNLFVDAQNWSLWFEGYNEQKDILVTVRNIEGLPSGDTLFSLDFKTADKKGSVTHTLKKWAKAMDSQLSIWTSTLVSRY